MTLAVGDLAPGFTLQDDSGAQRSLAEFLERGPVVLFFYPGALSKGCTQEACHFRDLAAEFTAVGAQRLGISGDTVDRQAEFAGAHAFDYPLLADVDGTVAEAYGVKRGGLLGKVSPIKRMTFVIGADGVVQAVVSGELRMDVHADEALRALRG